MSFRLMPFSSIRFSKGREGSYGKHVTKPQENSLWTNGNQLPKIGLCYLVFYAIVTRFVASMLMIFFEMVPDHQPNMTNMTVFQIDAMHCHYIDMVR